MKVLFICGLIFRHGSPIVKECLALFGGKITENGQYRLVIGLSCKILLQIWNQPLEFTPEPNFSQIGPKIKNTRISKDTETETKDDVVTS